MRKTPEEAAKTRLKVIDAALKLFSQYGYSSTTLNMIAQESGMSRGPIYWHFNNKDDLFEAVLAFSQEPLDQLIEAAADDSRDPLHRLEVFVHGWLDLLIHNRRHRQSFEILINKTELTNRLAATVKRERRLTRSIVDRPDALIVAARAAGRLPEGEPADKLALQLYTYLMGITQTWLFSPRLFSLKEQAPFFQRQVLATLYPHA